MGRRMNEYEVSLDIGYCTDNGTRPITQLYVEDENGEYPTKVFVPESRAISAEEEAMVARELEGLVSDLVGDLRCDDCGMRRDCEDNNRVACDGIAFTAIESMREAIAKIEKIQSGAFA